MQKNVDIIQPAETIIIFCVKNTQDVLKAHKSFSTPLELY